MNSITNPVEALQQLRELQRNLQALQSKNMFTDIHGADLDTEAQLFDALYAAERASMRLLDKLIDAVAAKRSIKEMEVAHVS